MVELCFQVRVPTLKKGSKRRCLFLEENSRSGSDRVRVRVGG